MAKKPTNAGGNPAPPKALKLDRILVPVDFSGCSLKALDFAVSLAQRLEVSLIVVHCVEPLHDGSLLEQKTFRRLHGEMVQSVAHQLDELCRQRVEPYVAEKHYVREGVPYQAILALARRTSSSLIVMGTQGRTGLKHVLMGSVAERVVRHASRPVLTVKG